MQQMQVVQDVIPLVKAFAMQVVIVDAKDVRDVLVTVVQLVRVVVKEVLVALIKHKARLLLHIPKAIQQEQIRAQVLQDA